MAFTSLPANSVDAKSPIDDFLMGLIKDDLDDLNSRVIAAGSAPHFFTITGRLSYLSGTRRSVAQAIVTKEFTPTQFRAVLKRSGLGGTLRMDIRKATSPKTPITEIAHQYNAATQSIAQAGSSLSTQSITRFATQLSTQSITHAKGAKNIQSIILIGTMEIGGTIYDNLVQYNVDSTFDSDTVNGDSVVVASATSGGNNGTFVIIEKNRGGGNNFVCVNASGVAQTGAAGTVQEKIMSYNYTNPVATAGFTAGYAHEFASHTTGANNGDLLVYKVNEGGNNVWVKNATGVVQAGVAGTLDTNFWVFAMSSAVSTTDYIVGERAKTASHSTGGNNAAALEIIAVNSGGNNVVLYNTSGATQGGAAGNVNTNRWVYALPTDPSSQITAGHNVYLNGHTNALNDGTFVVKEVNRNASNNVVVYNESGVAQGGTTGNVYTTRKLVKFSSDQSAVYSTDSYIEMWGCVDTSYNWFISRAPYQVLEVNRGGGANYNVVIENAAGAAQASPCGYIQVEMRSIFTVAPSIAVDLTSLEPNQNLQTASTSLAATVIPAQTPLLFYITEYMTGTDNQGEDLSCSIL